MREESETGEWQGINYERKREEREDVRDRAEEAANYLGDGPEDGAGEVGESLDGAFPVTAEVAAVYVLVPKDADEKWWGDGRIGIGACPVHSFPASYPIDNNPCPYQACSVFVADNPAALYRAAWSELLTASPDLPRRALWKSLLRAWRVERVEMTAVRIAWLEEVDEVRGGEPQVRRDGRSRRPLPPLSWELLRDVVGKRFASIAIVGGDPEALGMAARAVVFKVPFQALYEAKAITSKPIAPKRVPLLPRLRLGNRLLIMKLIGWPPGRNRVRDTGHFRLTMWRANRRKMRSQRRRERQAKRSARRDLLRRELGLDEPDAIKRAGVRRELIATVREAIGLVQSLAEALIELAKAVRGLVLAAVLLPTGAALAVLIRILFG